jgi:hypothetical protein
MSRMCAVGHADLPLQGRHAGTPRQTPRFTSPRRLPFSLITKPIGVPRLLARRRCPNNRAGMGMRARRLLVRRAPGVLESIGERRRAISLAASSALLRFTPGWRPTDAAGAPFRAALSWHDPAGSTHGRPLRRVWRRDFEGERPASHDRGIRSLEPPGPIAPFER